MKIFYPHLIKFFKEKPSIEKVSEKLFQLGHENEIENDVLDVELTPNRGDCLSVRGLARDLGVFYGFKDNLKRYDNELKEYNFSFTNKDPVKCPNISFLKIEVKNISKVYREYLESYFHNLKINKNNFFADVSNYVAYELGQPTHCYDLSKMSEELIFESSIDSGNFETLLNQKINLSGENCIFSNNGKVMSLAGVMGGLESACSINTHKVLVECAFFKPESIIGKSLKYNLNSEAAHKFERGVDPFHQEEVLRRFIKVVSDHSEIVNLQFAKFEKVSPSLKEIDIDLKKITSVIGNKLEEKQIKYMLKALNINTNKNIAQIPSYRHDISNNNDLAEEIARIIGYDNIKRIPFSTNTERKPANSSETALKNFLISNGFNEVINIPFVGHKSKNSIEVDNPLDSNRKFMRTRIGESLIDNLFYNEKRQKDSIKLFEISDIYSSKGELLVEKNFSLLVSGRKDKNYQDFSQFLDNKYLRALFYKIGYDLKENEIKLLDRSQYDSKIKTKVYLLEMQLSQLIQNYTDKEPFRRIDFSNCVQYKKISEYPLINRDLSFQLSDEDNLKKLEEQLLQYKTQNLNEVFVFDYYKNEEKKFVKIGFRFVFQSQDRTLTDAIVDAEIKDIVNSLNNINNIKIPGYEH